MTHPNNDIEPILSHIRTREEQGRMQEAVGMLERAVHQPAAFEKIIGSRVPEHCAQALRRAFEDEALKESQERLKEFFGTLKKSIGAMRLLTLDVAFSPSEKDIDAINTWVADNVGSDIVLDFTQDEAIGGGAKIMFEGKYTEKTLKQKIEKVFEEQRGKILEAIT